MTDLNDSILESVDTITSQLLANVRRDDDAAWRELFRIYHPLVYYWARRSGLESNDASDAAQEVFMGVRSSISRFTRDDSSHSFRGWLRQITRHKVVDVHRKRPQELPLDKNCDLWTNDDTSNGSCTAVEDKILFRTIVEMIQSDFSEKDWKAFWNVVIDERKPCDVAEELKMTRNQVYLAKSRILRHIRNRLANAGEE